MNPSASTVANHGSSQRRPFSTARTPNSRLAISNARPELSVRGKTDQSRSGGQRMNAAATIKLTLKVSLRLRRRKKSAGARTKPSRERS